MIYRTTSAKANKKKDNSFSRSINSFTQNIFFSTSYYCRCMNYRMVLIFPHSFAFVLWAPFQRTHITSSINRNHKAFQTWIIADIMRDSSKFMRPCQTNASKSTNNHSVSTIIHTFFSKCMTQFLFQHQIHWMLFILWCLRRRCCCGFCLLKNN